MDRSPKPEKRLDKTHLLWQCIAAIVYVTFVLVCLDIVSSNQLLWAVGSSSLASSAYLVFSQPRCSSSNELHLLGGYFIAIVCGLLVRHLAVGVMQHWQLPSWLVIAHDPHMFWMSGSIAVGITMVLMLIFHLEHPPAAGLSLVLVIEQRSYEIVAVMFLLVVLLAGIQMLFKRRLCNLS
jgi:hypothetical protein